METHSYHETGSHIINLYIIIIVVTTRASVSNTCTYENIEDYYFI